MSRRTSDQSPAGRGFGPDPVGDLLASVEAGSSAAANRLGELASADPAVLDRLAMAAADGSAPCLGLLLELVVSGNLVAPALSRLVAPESAEDIVQDILVAVSRSIGSYRGEARFTTWLYALSRNTAIAHLRRTRPCRPLADAHAVAVSAGPRLSSQVASRHAIRQAIETLPAGFRDPLILREIEGLSYDEIATRLDLNLNTVRSRLSRGRAMVMARLS